MISLRLQMFGGGGSGSGGKGGGKTGTGATNASAYSLPGHHGSAGGTKFDGGSKYPDAKKSEPDEKEKEEKRVSSPVRSIDRKETYIVYDSKGKEIEEVSGAVLERRINNREFRYNNSEEKWIDKRTNKQRIVRRKLR